MIYEREGIDGYVIPVRGVRVRALPRVKALGPDNRDTREYIRVRRGSDKIIGLVDKD
jgi:hypothetical protein